ncbi:helix-turn-helix domain-containing protein [Cohnella sp. REN36]|uniref:helix-turn-helix domain-containing protein n=1 Tax=Cohnella sp. REN36 TaxID=2887347 RepID=UPI001D152B40|nr:XRE family transcriptional regulator [Cohnella sp. REN36]MCC3372276.1 XRE family transcriptional regulator [Cohnella sp. REN36]
MDLGHRIKKMRLEQNRNMTEIAEICGFSKSLLSKIENGKTIPPISTLIKIAEALGTRVSVLLDDQQVSGTIYTPKETSQSRLVKTDKGYSFHTFAVERGEKMMQPFLFVCRKGEDDKRKMFSHKGEEFIFILEGEMRYKVGNAEFTLRPGDSLYFDSLDKHSLVPITTEVKYLAVFSQSKQ